MDVKVSTQPDGALVVTWPQGEHREAAILLPGEPGHQILSGALEAVKGGLR